MTCGWYLDIAGFRTLCQTIGMRLSWQVDQASGSGPFLAETAPNSS
jgi:hypothetical protein